MSPRDVGAAAKPEAREEPRPAFAAMSFDPAALVAQQQRMAEALVAAGQKFLEGLQDVTTRSLQLQTAFAQQLFMGAVSLRPFGAGDDADRGAKAAAAMESAVTSIRDVMTAACKCPMDALSTFQERIGRDPADAAPGGAACGRHQTQT